MPDPEFCLHNHCQMIVNRALILHTLSCFSRGLCYLQVKPYISYSFGLEKGMDGRRPSWVKILKDSVEHQNFSHYLVQACSSQNQNHKRGLTCTNCIHILQASHHLMCSEVTVIPNYKMWLSQKLCQWLSPLLWTTDASIGILPAVHFCCNIGPP